MVDDKGKNTKNNFVGKSLLKIDNFSTEEVNAEIEVKYKDGKKSDLSGVVNKNSNTDFLLNRSVSEIDKLYVKIGNESFEMFRISEFEWEYPQNARAGFKEHLYVVTKELGQLEVIDNSNPKLSELEVRITSKTGKPCPNTAEQKTFSGTGKFDTGWEKGCIDRCEISYKNPKTGATFPFTNMDNPSTGNWEHKTDTINVTAKETSGG